ncbi:zinc ABC transporter substrate-binding protein [Desulfovibrio sp. OttesenSCG-928-O18]|nr:zinc ABC transporter substrate-binding protein [Desulfovibrio sp. OttesenSCG-928-O18]
MNKTLTALCLFLLTALAPAPAFAAPIAVTVSIPPQKYFVERIGGSDVAVTVMVAAGRDPHSYEPTAAQMRNISGAELYFAIGVPFESQWVPKFAALSPAMRVVPLLEAVERITGKPDLALRDTLPGKGRHGHHGHGHDHGLESDDPHVWLSPEAVARTVPLMVAALSAARPDRAEAFQKRGEALGAEIAALEAELRKLFAPLHGRAFLTFHQSWAYYAKNFGLREVSVELEGREPGPKSMAMLMDFAAKSNARVIVADAMTARAAVESIAKGIHGDVVTTNPLEENWPLFMREFSGQLAAALKKTGAKP